MKIQVRKRRSGGPKGQAIRLLGHGKYFAIYSEKY